MFGAVIQIAGILDQREAEMLLFTGIDLLGFPLRLDYHREDLDQSGAGRIIRKLRIQRQATVITYLHTATDVLDLCEAVGAGHLQLHGDIQLDQLALIRASRPGLSIIKSLIVRDDNPDELSTRMQCWERYVDAFIVDSYDDSSGASGATGKVHDWTVSRALVERSRRPVLLAGGLTPENVGEAIRQVRPAGVDAHTGVEGTDGRKSRDRVSSFVAAARAAFCGRRQGSAAGRPSGIASEELKN